MNMSDEGMDGLVEEARAHYNVPAEIPRDAMWRNVTGRLGEAKAEEDVLDFARARERRASASTRTMGWAVAAAAVLVLGVGIGRMSAPSAQRTASGVMTSATAGSLALVAQEHLGRSESLLTMVRAEARSGSLDPMTADWASDLLSQTRMLIDVMAPDNAQVGELLLDLELMLMQIVEVAEAGSMDEARGRTELQLAVRSLETGQLLPRIQGVLPPQLSGT
jgi:hypothetical protein